MVVSKSSNSPPVSSRSTAEASRTTKVSQLHSWKKKKKKLRWVHVTSEEVNTALSGLLENTVVVLPESCVQAGGIQPNINDKNKPKKLWLGRLRYLRYLLTASMLEEIDNPEEVRRAVLQSAVHTVEHCRGGEGCAEEVAIAMNLAKMTDEELTTIARAAVTIQSAWRGARARKGQRVLDVLDDYFSDCVIKGFVVFLCGSTGIAGDSLRYVRMLAGMGYLVLAPDHMASNSGFFSRKDAAVIIRYEDGTDYWERNLLYEDAGAKGELVYSSTSDKVLGDPEHFDLVYNNVITIRQSGVSLILRRLPPFMKRHGVFFFGMSEGAVVLSSFNDEMYSDIIRGRIICGYSCEQNYWNYNRPEDAGIAGSPWIPTLNLMGYVDEFFGYQDSVAATVARCGEYPPILGNAFDAMVAAGIRWGLVAHLEGGRHALTWTHDDVIRELLSDFLERPQFVCRQLPHLWSHVKALQDEITRVRRSADNCVTYVRIRPPAPDAVISQNENEDVRSLLSKLNRRLYQLATDQPVSPMSDGGGLGRSFSELTSDMGEPVSSPVSNSVEESLRRSITTTMGTLNGSTKKAAAHVARVMCHVVDSKFSGVESGEPSSNPGTEPRKVKFAEANVSNVSKRPASLEIPKTCSATDLVLDGHSVQHHSQRGDARDNHEESGTAHSTPAIGTADSQRSSFDQPQLPKLILNSELTAAAQPGNKTLERSSHKQLSIFNSRPMSPEPEQPSSASRVSQWMEQTFQDPGYGPGDQAYQVWNKTEHERDLPVADRCRNERHGKQITERSNANHSSRTRTVWETEVLQHVREIFASQAEASTKTQQAISAMAEATSTVAISCAISSGVAAVSLAFLAFFGLSQSKR